MRGEEEEGGGLLHADWLRRAKLEFRGRLGKHIKASGDVTCRPYLEVM